jgi:hypothetical protein
MSRRHTSSRHDRHGRALDGDPVATTAIGIPAEQVLDR